MPLTCYFSLGVGVCRMCGVCVCDIKACQGLSILLISMTSVWSTRFLEGCESLVIPSGQARYRPIQQKRDRRTKFLTRLIWLPYLLSRNWSIHIA